MDALVTSNSSNQTRINDILEINFLDHVLGESVTIKEDKLDTVDLNDMSGNLTIIGTAGIFAIKPEDIESLYFFEQSEKSTQRTIY